MTRNEKQDVNRRVKRHSLFLHADWPVKLLLVLIYIAGAILVWNSQDALRAAGENDMVSPVMKMALDNTDAANLIPKNSKGRFLLHDRTLFQGYLIDEDNL
jgi:hypothetical protein